MNDSTNRDQFQMTPDVIDKDRNLLQQHSFDILEEIIRFKKEIPSGWGE
jgi:hypothetical protein